MQRKSGNIYNTVAVKSTTKAVKSVKKESDTDSPTSQKPDEQEEKMSMDSIYLGEAVEEGIKIDEFRAGHFMGPSGYLRYLEYKVANGIPLSGKFQKKILNQIIAKLSSKFYNGKSLNDIVKEATQNLGERVRIYKEIMNTNNPEAGKPEKYLSSDKLYSLPEYNHTDVDVHDGRFSQLGEIFSLTPPGEVPRSREQIITFLQVHGGFSGDIDSIISYLVTMRYI